MSITVKICKAGHRSHLRSCSAEQFAQLEHASTLGAFLWITLRFLAIRCVSDQLGALGRRHFHFLGNWRLNTGVEHA